MRQQVVTVTEFKAKCLSLLDSVSQHGGSILVTKRGRPLATVGPVRTSAIKSPEGCLAGKVDIPDKLLDADISHLWEMLAESQEKQD